ncbi:cyclopropane-fatty-acyl-phospholipid synthase [Altererythrobacter xiamenensis]|uniref:Cyclopropane-fatty-acyl-phospholipid synthase n=1 Tax=Altererythrobacter xiamenensis TaxID=1316679 RepID=A0A1Y6FMP7_9SPHN|nr:cyclopropane-fatty-acyl-phospholipid synthase family protein [Altererythrobacter xiamenensis]SMQ74711.1 cyclopropane-fatty-acyl-phospholipid synthase [Altererythrobacter xiamenensis]
MTAQGLNRGDQLLSGGERFASSPGLLARMVAPGFQKVLDLVDKGLERGAILGHLPDGTTRLLGGRAPGFEAEVHLKDWRGLLRLASNGSIGWYQAWEAGEWTSPDLVPVFAIFADNARTLGQTGRAKGPFRWAAHFAHRFNRNSKAGSQRNIEAHYDLGNDFYAEWLDPTMTYSSALFEGTDDLEEAQHAKWQSLSDRIGNAATVLEIGCGWGSLANHLSEEGGAQVTAISLSDEQLAWARAQHDPQITFLKQDYRDTSGQFDAIVSVEMVEALGREYWPTFMDCVARNLKSGGRAAIQYISMADDLFDAYAESADFIQAYIFPGGLLIRTSEFRKLAEDRGLEWHDQHDFGRDYARTLNQWRANFDRTVENGELPEGFDQRFVRLWRYYLDYCEGGFRAGTIDVHQVTLVKKV